MFLHGNIISLRYSNTIIILTVRTDRPEQTVKSDRGLQCLAYRCSKAETPVVFADLSKAVPLLQFFIVSKSVIATVPSCLVIFHYENAPIQIY